MATLIITILGLVIGHHVATNASSWWAAHVERCEKEIQDKKVNACNRATMAREEERRSIQAYNRRRWEAQLAANEAANTPAAKRQAMLEAIYDAA